MKKHFSFLVTLSIILLAFTGFASAEVMVFDAVASADKPVRLKALTKGKIFPEGGKLVKFYIDEKQAGKTLSGGDGYAFISYSFNGPGLKALKATSGDDTDEGVVLVRGPSRCN